MKLIMQRKFAENKCLRRAIAADGSSNVIGVPGITEEYDNSADNFNDLDDETPQAETIPQETSEIAANPALTPPSSDGLKCITPESRAIILPSTCLSSDHSLSLLELMHHQRQANRYIIALQNVICREILPIFKHYPSSTTKISCY